MKPKGYVTVVPRETNDRGEWSEGIEIEGVRYRIQKIAGESIKNPYNKQWGHKWYAVAKDITGGPPLVKVRVKKGDGMPKMLARLGMLHA